MTIFVLAVGLLGVAALMPVGSYQMQRGQIAQRVSEVAIGALDMIEAMEMTHPNRWLCYNTDAGGYIYFDAVRLIETSTPPHFRRINCATTGVAGPSDPEGDVYNNSGYLGKRLTLQTSSPALAAFSAPGSLVRSVIQFERSDTPDLTYPSGTAALDYLTGHQWRVKSASGSAIVADYIDPLSLTYPDGNDTTHCESLLPTVGDHFSIRRCEPFAVDPIYVSRNNTNVFVADAFGEGESMARITLDDGTGTYSGGLPQTMGQTMAEMVFASDDDLQLLDTDQDGITDARDGGTNGLRAESEGSYSWMATFAPSETETGSDPHLWTVSVVVFFKRPLGLAAEGQWTVPFTVSSAGNSGYTTATLDGSDPDKIYENNDSDTAFSGDAGDTMRIKRRQWGLVTYAIDPTPEDDNDDTEYRARWYRLGTVQKPTANNNDIKVRLIGPDLPVGQAKITFFEGLEGVFTRTMSIEELPLDHT